MRELNWKIPDGQKLLDFIEDHNREKWVKWPFESVPYPNPAAVYEFESTMIEDIDTMKARAIKVFFTVLDMRQKEGGGYEVKRSVETQIIDKSKKPVEPEALTMDALLNKLAEFQKLEARNKELRDALDRHRNATNAMIRKTEPLATVTLIGRVETAGEQYGISFYIDYSDWDVAVTNTKSNTEAGIEVGDIVQVVGQIVSIGQMGDVTDRMYVNAYQVTHIAKREA